MPLLASITLAALLESIVSFSGALLVILREEKIRRISHFVISFAIGALLGVAFLELIPEGVEFLSEGVGHADTALSTILGFTLGGMLLFFALEKFLLWYHCHENVCSVHTYTYLILWGDFLHNFIDGVIIALAFMTDPVVGLSATIAVILHEIPQEISDFGILLHGGFDRRKAILSNFFVSLSTIAGAFLTYLIGSHLTPYLPYAIALIAGNFIYLAATDLMPELHERTSVAHGVAQVVFIVAGAVLVLLPDLLLGGQ